MMDRLDNAFEYIQVSLVCPRVVYPRLVVVVEQVASGSKPSGAHGMKRVLSKLGVGEKEMVLHSLCPVDMTKVPCGYGGEGYRFRETRGWVKKISPLLQLVDRTLEETLLRVVSGGEDADADMRKDLRDSYGALKKLMNKEQVGRLKNARDGDGYVDFRDQMKRVPDGRGGTVWVRNENVQRWLDSHSNSSPSR
ncbi:unnamed protein product [Ectocarpus sp. CCAP 1310/34]|nr:unnamed protein product [Ectocarpus sp. CCAP 1310/34]